MVGDKPLYLSAAFDNMDPSILLEYLFSLSLDSTRDDPEKHLFGNCLGRFYHVFHSIVLFITYKKPLGKAFLKFGVTYYFYTHNVQLQFSFLWSLGLGLQEVKSQIWKWQSKVNSAKQSYCRFRGLVFRDWQICNPEWVALLLRDEICILGFPWSKTDTGWLSHNHGKGRLLSVSFD